MEQDGSGNTITVIITLLIFFTPLLLAWLSKRKRKKIEADLEKSKAKLNAAENQVKELNDKYSPIIDMELHTQQLLDEAEEVSASNISQSKLILGKAEAEAKELSITSHSKAEALVTDAELEVVNIKEESKELNAKANQNLKDTKEKVVVLTNEAHDEANSIIELAKVQAQEIAGDAYDAKLKAGSYESAIRAMKNTIEGYKDDYIIPNHSVLDDLAEEFSFKDAGEQLKQARKRVKEMVKQGHAGDCDYVEAHRKTYAIHFAVDAFNGKVDSALAKVKHDNFGKIKQEIIDAFALVNHNGAPFRSARINQTFLDARQEELKWAVSTHELRQIELAEQREIKQQIREEEKARKEMEKAIKEAEKEERLIQKALEKARAELANANEEQRKEFEAQLADLEGKLEEAEERGQRALSMAQQTRRGHVYVISNVGSFGENVFKIGMTRRLEPLDRVKELGDASVPFSFDVHAMLYSEDAPALEKELHRRFNREAVNKVNSRKEFFRTSLAEIKQMVELQGVTEVHWTMKAEAAEYRESLAIEAAQQEENVA
ncbi:MAG: ATPase [Gammaproteobacteria bacterium]|nr:MAG: ATPase [Gammaproteobacteria bacterium]